jgi:hypothetical protein
LTLGTQTKAKAIGKIEESTMKRKNGKAEDQAVDSESAGQPQNSKKDDSGMQEQNWSKSKKKRMRRLKGIEHRGGAPDKKGTRPTIVSSQSTANEHNTANESKDNFPGGRIVEKASEDVVNPENKSKLEMASGRSQSVLQKSFLARLSGSRFRELNEVSQSKCEREELFHWSQHYLMFQSS